MLSCKYEGGRHSQDERQSSGVATGFVVPPSNSAIGTADVVVSEPSNAAADASLGAGIESD